MEPHFHELDGLPRPDWAPVEEATALVENEAERRAIWSSAARLWLERLAEALEADGEPCEVFEGPTSLVLASSSAPEGGSLIPLVERCRMQLLQRLPTVTAFQQPGKIVFIAIRREDLYYSYISHFYEEGHFGGSGGVQIRAGGYPHIACHAAHAHATMLTAAHEMLHASLAHRELPLWLEEGLAQMFEEDMVAQPDASDVVKSIQEARRFWTSRSLDDFLDGRSFHAPSDESRHAYTLALIAVRALAAEHRPRWFGFDRRKAERFLGFLREASHGDGGAAAAERWLDRTLEAIIQRSLA
jgi:hypothetical protein